MMKKMKWIALLALVLAALLPCAALAARGDAIIARSDDMREKYQDNAYGACVGGDTLYFYGSEHIFTYHIGDADLTAVKYELPEAGEDEYCSIQRLFSDGEDLYALCSVSYYRDDTSGVSSVEIFPVEIGEDEARFGDPVEVNPDDLTVSYGGEGSYFIQINDGCYVDGWLMLYVYDDEGWGTIYALDTESGEGSFIEDVEEVRCITPYDDSRLLIETYDYNSELCEFLIYDPESESLSSACPPVKENHNFPGLAYSRETGRVFYMANGYVNAVEDFDFENPQQVAELSTLYYVDSSGLLLPGDYYVYANYDGTVIRSTDPDAMPETRIVVQGGGYSDSIMASYYSFGNTHGDAVVVLDQEYYPSDKIIESMMSRDSSVDVYMMSLDSEAYDALYNRGYMVELDNPEIVSAVEKMYPAVQDALTRDGDVVAVPVNLYGWTIGFDYDGFEKLGIAREDVPESWLELLDLLPELADKLPEDGKIRLFREYMTQSMVRNELISGIMEAWRTHQTAIGEEVSYGAPELLELFEKVMALDLEAMGIPEDDEDNEEGYSYRIYGADDPDREYTLIETSVGCTIGNFYSSAKPALLSVIPGEPGELPLQMSVAFVNPFSQNVELAQEFLVELMNNMENRTAYSLSDELNEPVRNRYSIQAIEEYQRDLEEQREKLETADPVDKPAIEEYIQSIEQVIEDVDRYSWDISEEEIAWYRAHADRLVVQRFDFLNAADDDGELSDLAEQFFAGRVSPADFLKEVDRKVSMRAREGN